MRDSLHARSQVPGHVPNARTAQRTSPPDRGLLELQRLAGNAAVQRALAGGAAARSPVLDVVSGGGGSPLAPDVKEDMEARLGADFSDVRVHTDATASRSAESVGARAYTVGSNVVFRSGAFDPTSTAGRTVLAHELTHVVQQRSGPVSGTPTGDGVSVSDPSDRFEREAETNAARVMAASTAEGWKAQDRATPTMKTAPTAQRIQIAGYQSQDAPPPLDTANLRKAKSYIRTLVSEENETAIFSIWNQLDAHILANVGVTGNDRKLQDYLRPIWSLAKKILDKQTEIAQATPSRLRLTASGIAKKVALATGTLASVGAVTNIDTLVSWITTAPQTNVIFGSMSVSSSASNQTVFIPGAHLRMVDPDTNRTLDLEFPDRTGYVQGPEGSANITQNPIDPPQGTQGFHTFALFASTFLGSVSLVSAGVWWWTKQSQASLDKIASANQDIRSYRERMTALCGQ